MSNTNQTIRSLYNEGGSKNWLAIHRALNVTADVLSHSVLTGKKQKTLFFKKTIYFFQSAFTLLISSLILMLLIMLLNNLPISLDGPFNCIWTYFTTKVETYRTLLNPKLKIKFYTRWNPKWFEKYLPNCILSFFLFHNNNSITINKFKRWATIRVMLVSFIQFQSLCLEF